MQHILVCLIVFASTVATFAQTPDRGEVELNTYSGEAIDVFDLREKGNIEGSSYYFEEWMNVDVKFTDGRVLTEYMGRYDLATNSLEIRAENKILWVPGSIIDEFVIEKINDSGHGFKSIRFIRLNQNPELARKFYEVLVNGDLKLLKGIEIEVLPPNYVSTHDAGNLNYKTTRKEIFCVASGEMADILPTKKKKAAAIMESYAPRSEKYILEENINFKKQDELIALFKYLNEHGS